MPDIYIGYEQRCEDHPIMANGIHIFANTSISANVVDFHFKQAHYFRIKTDKSSRQVVQELEQLIEQQLEIKSNACDILTNPVYKDDDPVWNNVPRSFGYTQPSKEETERILRVFSEYAAQFER